MIITRTPLRITLAGGGTDDPRHVKEFGGFAITAAIDKYVYVGVNRIFDDGYRVRYSEYEHADSLWDIKHPIVREALWRYKVGPHTEITSMADIHAGTGLGSSGAFTVGLCNAMSAYGGMSPTNDVLARDAAYLELERLGRPGGQQDHWATAIGGVTSLTFHSDGSVRSAPLGLDTNHLLALQSSLRLFFTGFTRDTNSILSTQSTKGLFDIQRAAYAIRTALLEGNVGELGELMADHWLLKQQRSPQMTNPQIDGYYHHALDNGAIGGKLVGAGGGGFLLFVADDHENLSAAMGDMGLEEVAFQFDHVGTTVLS